ncbi:MAG: hypothetical protein AAB037_01850, partial [Chloroflexota bacterium]
MRRTLTVSFFLGLGLALGVAASASAQTRATVNVRLLDTLNTGSSKLGSILSCRERTLIHM